MGTAWRYQNLFVIHSTYMDFHQVSGYYIMQKNRTYPGGISRLDPGGSLNMLAVMINGGRGINGLQEKVSFGITYIAFYCH